MRRLLLAVPLLIAVALIAALREQPHQTLAISYPAGWNLISAPDGSLVRGAQGPLYTFQPGDADYEIFPATSPLHGGYGYWAFFPNGGTVDLAAGTPRYTVTLIPGEYTMIGNPSSQASASVEGADQLLLYDPVSGAYIPSNEIPAGQGAIVLGSGTIVVTGVGNTQPITVAGSATATATAFNTNYTARCNDGTYDYAPRSAATCRAHEGVASFGPGAAVTASPTPINGNSQPQAACNDGSLDYSNVPNPCVGHGGVSYYIYPSFLSERVLPSPTPTPVPTAPPQSLNVSAAISPQSCAVNALVAIASVSGVVSSGTIPVNDASVTAQIIYTPPADSSILQSSYDTTLNLINSSGQYSTNLDVSGQPSGTFIDVIVNAYIPGTGASGNAKIGCTKP